MGQEISSVTVQDTNDPSDKNLIIVDSEDKTVTIPFSEEAVTYKDNNLLEVDPKFCLLPEMDPAFCGRYLSPEMRKLYIMEYGQPCRSLSFRPGSLIRDDRTVPDYFKSYVVLGNRCRFVKDDYQATDDDAMRCCSDPSAVDCPHRFHNGYTTTDCDLSMSKFCRSNPNSVQCMDWLRSKSVSALNTYSDICAKDLDKDYCSEFVRVARPIFYTYADDAIKRFCKTHSSDKRCWCIYPPSPRVANAESYLGPRVCWLHECTDETHDRKYLLFDQDVQRKKCSYVGCTITVDSLLLKNSDVELIADCSRNVNQLFDDPGTSIRQTYPISILSPIWIVIPLAVLYYFFYVYARKRVNSNVINVRRKT